MFIKIAHNGFIIEDNETNIVEKKEETNDTNLQECIAMHNLLYIVKERLGLPYNKQNRYNVRILVEDSDGDEIEV